ncbi:MAG: exosortase-dependent surface protein XDP2 [Cyanobacteria bacterium J06626_23]
MKSYRFAAAAGLAIGGMLLLGHSPAQAFRYTTNLADGADAPKGDVILDSVSILDDDGQVLETISDFTLVTDVNIVSNDVFTGGNTGAASVDIGDNASGTATENPSDEQLADVLENKNLNNIIDTEDDGNFAIDVIFEDAVDNLFVWERGMNSDIKIQGLDEFGNVVGTSFLVTRDLWTDAGYGIDTTEIDETQQVGSFGISMADLGLSGSISGFRMYSETSFNGPDWKILGSKVNRPDNPAQTPEPTAMAGLGLIAGTFVVSRRKRRSAAA